MLETNKIYCGDSFDIMKEIDDKSIQLIVTSPPYNASIRKDNHKYPGGNYEDSLTDEEYIEWSANIFKDYQRVLKDDGVVAYNMSYTTFSPSLPYLVIAKVLAETDFVLADTLCWKKKSAVPLAGHPNRLTRICEFVYIFVKKDSIDSFRTNKIVSSISVTGQKYFRTYYNYLETKNNDGSTEIHKATYSTDFVKYFIDLYSFEDDIVLDNFMGTGTSAIGCIDLNRKYIGIDMCQEYVDHSNERIANHTPDPTSIHTPEKVKIKDRSGEPKKPKKKKEVKVEEVKKEVEAQIEKVIEETKSEDFWG